MEWNEPGGMPDRPQVELPELPDAVMHNSIERGYNARQMHAYARQAIAESEARAEGLVKLLREVSDWIDNWGPNFADDAEWQPVAERITAAIAAQREAASA